MKDKSALLQVDVRCNSKDLDAGTPTFYEHYNRENDIEDECPEILAFEETEEDKLNFLGELIDGELDDDVIMGVMGVSEDELKALKKKYYGMMTKTNNRYLKRKFNQ